MSFPNRFTVFCAYDGAMVKFFNEIDRRFWDSKFKTWWLPSTAYDRVMRYFTCRNLKFETLTVDVVVYKFDHELCFKYNNWQQNMDALKRLDGIQYDRESKSFAVPEDQQDALLDTLAECDNTFIVRDVRSPQAQGIAPVEQSASVSGFKPYKRRTTTSYDY
jgi:hypothetical protein